MTNHQHQALINHYFFLLINQFITDPQQQDITLTFKTSRELGKTKTKKVRGLTIQRRKGTVTNQQNFSTRDIYSYEVQFLKKGYKNLDELRETVIHEFTHLYLFSTIGNHQHDNRFYAWMAYLESWFDRNQNLAPRQDKSQDQAQHIDWKKRNMSNLQVSETVIEQLIQERDEFLRLVELIRVKSPDLATLEQNWQIIQNHPLYSSNQKSFELYGNNKSFLDKEYNKYKEFFQQSQVQSTQKNSDGSGWMWLIIIGGVFIISWIIIGEMLKPHPKPRKKLEKN